MKLPPRVTIAWANAVAHALGLRRPDAEPLVFAEGRRGSLDAVFLGLGAALDGCAPSHYAPSIGALVAQLAWSASSPPRRAWPARPSGATRPLGTKRILAELGELVTQGAFDRTKRAERGRVLAEMVLLFDLEHAVDVVPDDDDPEESLRRVRRALASR